MLTGLFSGYVNMHVSLIENSGLSIDKYYTVYATLNDELIRMRGCAIWSIHFLITFSKHSSSYCDVSYFC